MATTHDRLLALGDCNTLGNERTPSESYPSKLGQRLGVEVVNCGHTMSTVREGYEYAVRQLNESTRYLTIQYGLVDSWTSFRGAPYVLYYPDNPARQLLRKVVKSYKKIGRKLGFRRWFGERPVVTLKEYRQTIGNIIVLARDRCPQVRICLVATAPSLENSRNAAIEQFNAVLQQLTREEGLLYVDAYAPFAGRPEFYRDVVHLTGEAHAIIAELCVEALRGAGPVARDPHEVRAPKESRPTSRG